MADANSLRGNTRRKQANPRRKNVDEDDIMGEEQSGNPDENGDSGAEDDQSGGSLSHRGSPSPPVLTRASTPLATNKDTSEDCSNLSPLSSCSERKNCDHSVDTLVKKELGSGDDGRVGAMKIEVDVDGFLNDQALLNSTADEELIETGANCTSHFYINEWNRLFLSNDYIESLKKSAISEGLRCCHFRSVCWKLFLEILPETQASWSKVTKMTRDNYNTIKAEWDTNPWRDGLNNDLSLNNPLSQEETSPWNQYFQDNELKLTIKQDVIRTFPEIEFFHDDSIRKMMIDILFCYAKKHPNILYKQGMHELLGPLIFILHSDHQTYLHMIELESLPDTLKDVLDPVFIEHDSYALFCKVMEAVGDWYIIKETNTRKGVNLYSAPFTKHRGFHSNAIFTKLSWIHECLLKRHSIELYNHLNDMEITPQIYGIRWLRLLYGREFPLQDLLVLWDAIFADSPTFCLVFHLFVSMLIFIKDWVLSGDYAECLNYLMRYPTATDVHYIIGQALHLRNPREHPMPSAYTVQMMQHQSIYKRRPLASPPLPKLLGSPSKAYDKQTARPSSLALKSGDSNAAEPKGATAARPTDDAIAFVPSPKEMAVILKEETQPGTRDSKSTSRTGTREKYQTLPRSKSRCSDISEHSELSSYEVVSNDADYYGNVPDSTGAKSKSFSVKNSDRRFQQKYAELVTLCEYCSKKLTLHIAHLQHIVSERDL